MNRKPHSVGIRNYHKFILLIEGENNMKNLCATNNGERLAIPCDAETWERRNRGGDAIRRR